MIIRNGKMTAWTDTMESLVEAAVATVRRARMQPGLLDGLVIRSEAHEAEIREEMGDLITTSPEVAEEVLRQGYWIERDEPFPGQTALLLDWSKKPNNPPSNRAIHA